MELSNLFNVESRNFFERKIELSDIAPAKGEDKTIPTTFRMPTEIKNYYQLLADVSRSSLQGAVVQALSSIMYLHVSNKAERYAVNLSNRFFAIFEAADIPIRQIGKFLKDFDVKHEDLTSENRIVDLMSEELVDFLATNFLLKKDWITCEDGDVESHNYLNCHENISALEEVIKQSTEDLNLKVLFDDRILSNPEILTNTSYRRYVYFALKEECVLNNIPFNRIHLLNGMSWDHEKATIEAVLKMQRFQDSSKIRTQLFAFERNNLDVSSLGHSILTDFHGYGRSGVVIAEYSAKNIRSSRAEFREIRKMLQLDKVADQHLGNK